MRYWRYRKDLLRKRFSYRSLYCESGGISFEAYMKARLDSWMDIMKYLDSIKGFEEIWIEELEGEDG